MKFRYHPMMNKISYVLIFLLSILTSFTLKPKTAGCLELDLILLGDYSSSLRSQEHYFVDACRSFVKKFQLSEESIKIGIVTFNDTAKLISPLSSDTTFITNRINELAEEIGESYTNMEIGLFLALNELTLNGRPNAQKIIIVLSDGAVNDPGDAESAPITTMAIIQQLRMTGIGICSILIKSGEEQSDFMKAISSGCYAESNYENLAIELSKLDVCL